jgi:hypothetical protein
METLATPVTVSELIAPVPASPVTATFAAAVIVKELIALVPAKPVSSTGIGSPQVS